MEKGQFPTRPNDSSGPTCRPRGQKDCCVCPDLAQQVLFAEIFAKILFVKYYLCTIVHYLFGDTICGQTV